MTHTDLATAGGESWQRIAAEQFAIGLAVVTSRDATEGVTGRLVSSITSLSLEPPSVLLAVPSGSELQQAIDLSGALSISLLRDDQTLVAERLSDEADASTVLGELGIKSGQHGQPMLTDCLSYMEGVVTESLRWESDHLYVCRILGATTSPGRPLLRYRGVPGRYQAFQDAADYANFRSMVLDRVGSNIDVLTIGEVASSLGMEEASVQDALVRLQDDGLVRVNPADGTHVIMAIDQNGTNEALEARLLMELAATQVVGDSMTTAQMEEFNSRRVLCLKAASTSDYHYSHLRFHEYAITLTGNSLLVDAYRNFNVPNETWDAISEDARLGIEEDHQELVVLYRNGDMQGARALLRRHRKRTEYAISASHLDPTYGEVNELPRHTAEA